jgi:hypothetical protein
MSNSSERRFTLPYIVNNSFWVVIAVLSKVIDSSQFILT